MKKIIMLLICCLIAGCSTKPTVVQKEDQYQEYLLYIDNGSKLWDHPSYSKSDLKQKYKHVYATEDAQIIAGLSEINYPLYTLKTSLYDEAKINVYTNNELQYSLQDEIKNNQSIGEFNVYPYYDDSTLDVLKSFDNALQEDVIPIYVAKSFLFNIGLMETSDKQIPEITEPFIVDVTVGAVVGKNEMKPVKFKAQVMGVLSNCSGDGDMYCKYDIIEKLIQDQLGYLPHTDAYILLTKEENLEEKIDLSVLSEKSLLVQQDWMPTYDKTIEGRLNEHNRK